MSAYIGANVFVTGASRGIGLGLVQRLVERADVERVFAGARKPDEATQLQEVAKASEKVRVVQFDSLDDASIQQAVKSVESEVGERGLNLLINNAGIYHSDDTNILDHKRDALLLVFNTNVVGVAMTTAAFFPLLQRAASAERPAKCVNVSSMMASIANLDGANVAHGSVTYAASKAALNAVTKQWGTLPAAAHLVTVALCPGWVRTDMGGPRAALAVPDSTAAILRTVSALGPADSGRFMDRNGQTIPY